MQNEMAQMKKQNELLTQMVQNQVSQRRNVVAKAAPQYTHSGLAKYFKNKHLNAAMLKKDVLAEERRLKEATESDVMESATSLLEVSEGDNAMSAKPLYNKRAEEARMASEDLVQRAIADAVAM